MALSTTPEGEEEVAFWCPDGSRSNVFGITWSSNATTRSILFMVGYTWMKVLEVASDGDKRLVADRNCSSAFPYFPHLTMKVSCYKSNNNYRTRCLNNSCGQFYQCTTGVQPLQQNKKGLPTNILMSHLPSLDWNLRTLLSFGIGLVMVVALVTNVVSLVGYCRRRAKRVACLPPWPLSPHPPSESSTLPPHSTPPPPPVSINSNRVPLPPLPASPSSHQIQHQEGDSIQLPLVSPWMLPSTLHHRDKIYTRPPLPVPRNQQ
ncbi:hypothetical protein Pmani_011561 [Petrolisthes manimaculis]|uniref:Uncharacterized protein n=1 Tax=Petrolisthes manimaculis TaxID=1843537 RepID=A0AAE1PZU2_9EUCA|nr:hypothetical protein Pmani_011561 [Petrolisthes manimaculis]